MQSADVELQVLDTARHNFESSELTISIDQG